MPEPAHVSTTRASYDATADVYAELIGTEVSVDIEGPIDRAMLGAFADIVAEGTPGPVADVGCGPGRVASLLATRGLDVVGFDISPAMLAIARRAHSAISFAEGSLTDLPIAGGTLAGAVCWYSIIHSPPDALDDIAAELARALAPGGHLLLAFQAGDGEGVHRHEVCGIPVSLTSYRHAPDEVARHLVDAGFEVRARTVRAPERSTESTPQAFILARAVGASGSVEDHQDEARLG